MAILTDFPPYTLSIHHDGSGRYVQIPHPGEPQIGDEVLLRLRTAPEAPIERILLRLCPDGEQLFLPLTPQAVVEGAACRWWQVSLHLSMPVTSYRFLFFTAGGVFWLNAGGFQRHNPTDAEDFKILCGYQAPDWVRSSVFYQIFPDRFANGDPQNDVVDGEWEYWGTPVKQRGWGEPPSGGRAASLEFYGGDLAGIEAHLDYLQNLGINALYLTPIFTAHSNHRYDVVDYFNVDPHLGGNPALVSLRRASAERGLRLMLDIVPNHCGVTHPWFQAAQADINAPTAEYFTFTKHPDEYACWLGVRGLPKLNYRSQALRQVMYAGAESVFRTWLRPPYAIDAWRLDVANMLARQGPDQLGLEVGRGIRQAVKEENSQAYILGENFFDGSPQLQGDCWDAVMNYYGFSKPLWYWLDQFKVNQHAEPHRVASQAPWPTQALVDSWQAYRAAIPWTIAIQQFNLLGSHDTERILGVVHGDEACARLAAGVLLTYPGVPSIYYGDEIALGGSQPNTTRACMQWDSSAWNQDLRSFYQTLIHLRRTSPALIEGGFQVLAVEDDTLAYLRDNESEQIIVICQRSGARPAGLLPVAHGGIPDGAEFEELFSGRRQQVTSGCLPMDRMEAGVQIWKTSGI